MHSTDFISCPVTYCLLSPMRLPLSMSSPSAFLPTAVRLLDLTNLPHCLPPMSWVTDEVLLVYTCCLLIAAALPPIKA